MLYAERINRKEGANMKEEKKLPPTEEVIKPKTARRAESEEYDPYEGYTRENPPPWLDEFEYIDFMMTH